MKNEDKDDEDDEDEDWLCFVQLWKKLSIQITGEFKVITQNRIC